MKLRGRVTLFCKREAGSLAYCAHCKQKVLDDICPLCGRDTERPVVANRKLQVVAWLLLGGLLGVLAGAHVYRPLDSERLMMWAILFFFLPFAPHLILGIRKRITQSIGLIRNFYLVCSIVLLAMAAAITANGALDSLPVRQVQTTVIQKQFSSGRYSVSYLIWVSSWRPGRSDERLEVSRELYSTLEAGRSVIVPLHSGALGLPWYGIVSPAR